MVHSDTARVDTARRVPTLGVTDPLGMTDGGAVAMPGDLQTALLAEDSLWGKALRIHYNGIVIDGHIDTPTLMLDQKYDFTIRHQTQRKTHQVDLPRMIEGGLDAAFFSLYVASAFGEAERATERARAQLNEVNRQVALSDQLELATSANAVRRISKAGRKAVLLGIEGGHAIAGSTEVLAEMHRAGVRYVTLTHVNSHSWADGSQSRPRWNGLNDLGREIVREMNRLGVLVDVAHVSDSTFYDVLAVTQAPVIASHSSARALSDNVRNLTDDMLRALAEKGGVAMINFFPPAVNTRLTTEVMREAYQRVDTAYGGNLRQLWAAVYATKAARGIGRAGLKDVLDHIDHAVKIAGIDHVGLGSDFDGAPMPVGLEDVTRLPWLTYGLLKRGYTEADIYKILGGNTLRVLEQAEKAAAFLQTM